jgi:hypothetical protein
LFKPAGCFYARSNWADAIHPLERKQIAGGLSDRNR